MTHYTIITSQLGTYDKYFFTAARPYCGHKHRTPIAAVQCEARIQRPLRNSGGRLDIYIVAKDANGYRWLTQAEAETTYI